MFGEWVLVHFELTIGVTRFCDINLNITLINKVLDIVLKLHAFMHIMTIDAMVVTTFVLIIPSRLGLIRIKRVCYQKEKNVGLDELLDNNINGLN